MARFFLGLSFGVVLTLYSFAFVGVGHGTYAPMVFNASILALIPQMGVWPALLLGPFLWASYFQFLPKMQQKRIRLSIAIALLTSHLLTGTRLAFEDPAFARAMNEETRGLLIFGLILSTTMTCLLYFVARGVKP